MNWIETRVVFDHPDPHLAAELIADRFHEAGLAGVVIEDPTAGQDEDWAGDAVQRPRQHAVVGYFSDTAQGRRRQRELRGALVDLETRLGARCRLSARRVADEDWAESWKTFFHPEQVGARLVVKPSWQPYHPKPGQLVLELDPGMAFGTGTHATTRLCLQLLEAWVRPGMRVLDVGTGSGILLLAAHRLGASRLEGLDTDAVAVTVAAENLRRNAVPPERCSLRGETLTRHPGRSADLIVANILAHVVIDLLDEVPARLAPGGVFVCSGIVAARRPEVAAKLAAVGLALRETRLREEWVAMAAVRP